MEKDIALDNYYYNQQLRKHIVQFMAVFGGLKVSVGKNDFGSETNLMTVPIVYGSRDRVVSHILADQTQNKVLRLPAMSANIIDMQIFTDRLAGQNQERKDIKLKRGGTIPDDLVQHSMLKPVPYDVTMELSINASNNDQHFQILEQILLLFNPSIQLQVSDAYGNQQSYIEVILRNISMDENYPAGTDDRIVSSTLTFSHVMYLSGPVSLRDEIIRSIQVRVSSTLSGGTPSDINEGIVDPFIITTENWDAPS